MGSDCVAIVLWDAGALKLFGASYDSGFYPSMCSALMALDPFQLLSDEHWWRHPIMPLGKVWDALDTDSKGP